MASASDTTPAQALSLKWSFGFNKAVTGGVHNLSDDSRNAIFYLAAHTGVVYDYVNRKQTLLQGHCNPITCCAVSADKRWIATADEGKDSMIVVWDSLTGTPIKTIFNPHPNGVKSIDMSPDAMFLVTLSSPSSTTPSDPENQRDNEEGKKQFVAVWEWTVEHDGPLYVQECPAVKISSQQESEIASSSLVTKTPKRSRLSKRVNGRKGPKNEESNEEEKTNRMRELEIELEEENMVAAGFQHHVRFNPYDIEEFVTTGPNHVTFWSWKTRTLEQQTPGQLRKADFGSKVGNFTHTVFLPNHPKAVSGTSEGNLVLWDSSHDDLSASQLQSSPLRFVSPAADKDANEQVTRSAIKVVKLNRHGSIPYLTMRDDLLVVCGEDESVRFYDLEFRIVAWFEDLDAGPVQSVSFSNASNVHYVDMPFSEQSNQNGVSAGGAAVGGGQNSPINHSGGNKDAKYALSDFVVGTSRALIVGVDATTFDDPNIENRHGTLLLQGFDGPITSLVTNPQEDTFVAISRSGIVQAWDYHEKRLMLVRVLDQEDKPTCAAFSKDGNFLAIGFHNGTLRILRWGNVRDFGEVACFQIKTGIAYTLLEFSPDSAFLAFADKDNCVGLFRFVPSQVHPSGEPFAGVHAMKVNQGKRRAEPGPGLEPSDGSDIRNGWVYIGRYGSHTDKITCIQFGRGSDDSIRLISVAQDGYLVEYDIEQSSVVDGIQLTGLPKKVEHAPSLPTCCLLQPANKVAREDLIIMANTDYKLKSFNANNKMCRKTTLGPVYGGSLTHMQLLHSGRDENQDSHALQYVAYRTKEKVIGLVKLPLDGNPYKSMGLIAHPGEITGFCASKDGRLLLSAGGSDMTINVWSVNASVLDATAMEAASQSVRGVPKGLVPFLPLIPGGYQGELYQEIVDYFYYAQLRCQGEETTSPRRTEGYVPLTEIPNLMRALGYYPSEHEIENMVSEVRYSEFASTANTVDVISLEHFIKLYLNHKPVAGVTQEQIEGAFETIKRHLDPAPESLSLLDLSVEWKGLKKLLETTAEAMPTKELETCLIMLIGRKGLASIKPTTAITLQKLSGEILGLEDEDGIEYD